MYRPCFLVEDILVTDTHFSGDFRRAQVINIDQLEDLAAFVWKRLYLLREYTQDLRTDHLIPDVTVMLLHIKYLFISRPLFLEESQVVDTGIAAGDVQEGADIIQALEFIPQAPELNESFR